MSFNPCCVVPSRNHHQVIDAVIGRVRAAGLPVIVVDDASDTPTRAALAALHAPAAGITVDRLPERGGKGGAVLRGMALAAAAGHTHVLQVDADGQHDLERLPDLLAAARRNPAALVTGTPVFDASVPRGRRVGREITRFWVALETLSRRMPDAMCGFRVYPLAAVAALTARQRIGRFMDFDPEILVRLHWHGTPIVAVPVKVVYPVGNTSNFELLRDNWRISRMHARLFLGGLLRLPQLLTRATIGPERWSALGERGSVLGIRILALAYLRLGAVGSRLILYPVVFYFFVTDPKRRAHSRDFLTRAYRVARRNGTPTAADVLAHFVDFGVKVLETFAAWVGRIAPDRIRVVDGAALEAARSSGRGALLVVSHLGNAELARALLGPALTARLTVLVHTRGAERFNRVLRDFQPAQAANLVQVTEIDPATGAMLQERIERGEWVAIAGDRVPVGFGGAVVRVPFLGETAPFPTGPYLLAHLLGCPVYTLFCLREGRSWRVHFEKFAEAIRLPRGTERAPAIEAHAARYAGRLGELATAAPSQWYNFFDFWNQ